MVFPSAVTSASGSAVSSRVCWYGDPREDLDLASYGIVKVLEDGHGEAYPDMAWEPKAAFRMLAEHHRG